MATISELYKAITQEDCIEKNFKTFCQQGKKASRLFDILEAMMIPGQSVPSIVKTIREHINPVDDFIFSISKESSPHGKPLEDLWLKQGHFYTIDIAFKSQDRWFDSARTFSCGMIDCQRREMLGIAQKNFLQILNEITMGMNFRQLLKRCSLDHPRVKYKSGMGGHGLGENLHQRPELIFTMPQEYEFREGDCFTIEPVYVMDLAGHEIYFYNEVSVFIYNGKVYRYPEWAEKKDSN